MPKLSKSIISAFIKSDCERRFVLDLFHRGGKSDEATRKALKMPDRQPHRPGFELVSRAGEEWQYEKVQDLVQAFGAHGVQWFPAPTPKKPFHIDECALGAALDSSSRSRFIVEAEFELTGSFKRHFGLDLLEAQPINLKFSTFRPDLVYVDDQTSSQSEILFDGEIIRRTSCDKRIGLRVIDIKLTSEPSAAYFAETALYSIALAGWLRDTGRDQKYYVRSDAAVWPGSYEASPILIALDAARRAGRPATSKELIDGLDQEVENTPVDVFVPRLTRILKEILPRLLKDAPNWKDLPWDVTGRCRNCEYLGMRWGKEDAPSDLCIPEAARQDHLSRLAFVPRGAFRKLRSNAIHQVRQLHKLDESHSAFEAHPQLRATKGIVRGRAGALSSGYSGIAQGAPSSSVLPKWPDIRIFLTAEFDPSSAISVAFALNANWWSGEEQPDAEGSQSHQRTSKEFLISNRSLYQERTVFLLFLQAIFEVMEKAKKDVGGNPSVQIYVWDSITYEHLSRLVGRHLDEILKQKALKNLAWLFPPNDLIGSSDLIHRGSVIAIVGDAVRTSLATPIPHVYSLLNVARTYHLSRVENPEALFHVDPFYEDPLTSQIPIERIHEFWNPAKQASEMPRMSAALTKVLQVKLRALEHIAIRLTIDLRDMLIAKAPLMNAIKPPTAKQGMAAESQLVYAYAELNNALAAQENVRLRSLQMDEREASFASAKLAGLYRDPNEVLNRLKLDPLPNRFIFNLGPGSREVKAKSGDFTFAVADPNRLWFLETRLISLVEPTGTSLPDKFIPYFAKKSWGMMPLAKVMSAAVVAIDRNLQFIVLDFNEQWWPVINWLLTKNAFSFDSTLMLDPIHQDFFLGRLEKGLKTIGIPALSTAAASNLPNSPIGSYRGATAKIGASISAAAEMLWDCQKMESTPSPMRDINDFPQQYIESMRLNKDQLDAVRHAFCNRFTLIWGPPGTGKTHTLVAAISSMIVGRSSDDMPRILVSAQTYAAIDEVLRKLTPSLQPGAPLHGLRAYRIRSQSANQNQHEFVNDVPLKTNGVVTEIAKHLLQDLILPSAPILVFGPPQQIFNLAEIASDDLIAELFDVVVLDEAGQLDFGNGALPLMPLRKDGAVVVAGDPLQLPPIRQTEPPEAFKDLLGSLYDYLKKRRGVSDCKLSISYRSNQVILDAVSYAGYATLTSEHPRLKANYSDSTAFDYIDDILDPNLPCCALIYDDGEHAQSNPVETQLVGAFIERLKLRLRAKPTYSETDVPIDLLYEEKKFWQEGVGIVTPHRAQQAMIVSDLQERFPADEIKEDIRAAVDTVERFQGQQRDVIVISFCLGDTDAILAEEEFLMSLNRFNVMISRARVKVIVIISRQVLDYLSDNIEVLNESRMLKWFCDTYCKNPRTLQVTAQGKNMNVEFRSR